jgi:triphosphoribosyl-dephospho-CoA synthase
MSIQHQRNLHAWVSLACTWEATARKAGNVHPHRDFHDLVYRDFVLSAMAIAPVFAQAAELRVGELVLRAIQATRHVVQTNTNLGIVLLLAPLAAASSAIPLSDSVGRVLAGLTLDDSERAYEAIRLAVPGGMGQVAQEDVRVPPTLPLVEVMALAQDRDLIARQYVNGFHEVLNEGVPALVRGVETLGCLEHGIVGTHLELLARHADSLIARKCGPAVAVEVSQRARAVLNAGWPLCDPGLRAFDELDAWLRADGNRRNPGTSADLVTACLFAGLAENRLDLSVPWSRGEH